MMLTVLISQLDASEAVLAYLKANLKLLFPNTDAGNAMLPLLTNVQLLPAG